jgi:hypothetical protein
MMAHLHTIEGLMGRKTDYQPRTIDDHIEDFEDVNVI